MTSISTILPSSDLTLPCVVTGMRLGGGITGLTPGSDIPLEALQDLH